MWTSWASPFPSQTEFFHEYNANLTQRLFPEWMFCFHDFRRVQFRFWVLVPVFPDPQNKWIFLSIGIKTHNSKSLRTLHRLTVFPFISGGISLYSSTFWRCQQQIYKSHDSLTTWTPVNLTPTCSIVTKIFLCASRWTLEILSKQYTEPRHPQFWGQSKNDIFFSGCHSWYSPTWLSPCHSISICPLWRQRGHNR